MISKKLKYFLQKGKGGRQQQQPINNNKMSARIVKKRVLVMKCQGCGENCRVDNMNIREKMCIDCVEQLNYLYQYDVCSVYLSKDLYDEYLAHHTSKSVNQKIKKTFEETGDDYLNVYAYYPTCGGMMWIVDCNGVSYLPIYVKSWNGSSPYAYAMCGLVDEVFEENNIEDGLVMKKTITEIKGMCPTSCADFLEKLQ